MKSHFAGYLIVFSLSFSWVFAQVDKKSVNQAIVARAMMEKYHYDPPAFDDDFSEKVFDDFIKSLDADHLFFTQQDIQRLSAFRAKIDDELNSKSQAFLNLTSQLFKVRLLKADSFIVQLLSKPVDFTNKESMVFPMDSTAFAASEKEFEDKWRKWLKFEMLQQLMDKHQADTTLLTSVLLKNEPAVRDIVKKINQRRIKKILDHSAGYDTFISTVFCNAVTCAYDPHSEFMPPTEMENFEGLTSGRPYSFGLEFDENENGNVSITHILPGSPAWKNGELNKDDVLVQMKWHNKKAVDLEGADIREVEELFSEENHDKLQLTVRKTDGLEKQVTLIKEKMLNDESFVKGFMLKGSRNIGYISLPGFYSEWGSFEGTSCAGDVAKEIVKLSKLSKEKIDGLILDVRYNGGGSLQEALDMSGIFIDEGTLAFTKERTARPVSLKDLNRGTIYNGPLLVLVNRQSASASELLAGALQDYNRAIIVGGNTFGKATSQVVLPADTFFNLATAKTLANGYVKVTMEKLYRPTGKTNQFDGVKPDIILPDIYDEIQYSEASLPHAILPDTVKRSSYFSPLQPLPVSGLRAKSVSRTANDEGFNAIIEYSRLIGKKYFGKKRNIPLDWQQFKLETEEYYNRFKQYSKRIDDTEASLYTVENSDLDKAVIASDSYKSEINNNHIKKISHDIYIMESFNIITDYINMSK